MLGVTAGGGGHVSLCPPPPAESAPVILRWILTPGHDSTLNYDPGSLFHFELWPETRFHVKLWPEVGVYNSTWKSDPGITSYCGILIYLHIFYPCYMVALREGQWTPIASKICNTNGSTGLIMNIVWRLYYFAPYPALKKQDQSLMKFNSNKGFLQLDIHVYPSWSWYN